MLLVLGDLTTAVAAAAFGIVIGLAIGWSLWRWRKRVVHDQDYKRLVHAEGNAQTRLRALGEERDQLTHEVGSRTAQLEQLLGERTVVNQEVHRLKGELAAVRASNPQSVEVAAAVTPASVTPASAPPTTTHAGDELAAAMQTNAELRSRLSAAEQARRKLSSHAVRLQERLTDLVAASQPADEASDVDETAAVDAQRELAVLRRDLAAARADRRQAMNDVQSAHAEAEREREATRAGTAELADELARLKRDVRALERSRDGLLEQLADERSRVRDLKESRSTTSG